MKELEIYKGIEKEVNSLEKGQMIDFGCGSYRDSMDNIVIERSDVDSDIGKIFYVNNHSTTKVKKIIAIVYRGIIDAMTELRLSTDYF